MDRHRASNLHERQSCHHPIQGIHPISGLLGYVITNLCNVKSFGKPFMFPIAPVIKKSNKALIRKGLKIQNTNKGES